MDDEPVTEMAAGVSSAKPKKGVDTEPAPDPTPATTQIAEILARYPDLADIPAAVILGPGFCDDCAGGCG